jgi:hypothetical protein
MSTIALILHHSVVRQLPEYGADLSAAFLSALIVMELAGPIAVQFGLRFAGETAPEEPAGATTGRHAARAPSA